MTFTNPSQRWGRLGATDSVRCLSFRPCLRSADLRKDTMTVATTLGALQEVPCFGGFSLGVVSGCMCLKKLHERVPTSVAQPAFGFARFCQLHFSSVFISVVNAGQTKPGIWISHRFLKISQPVSEFKSRQAPTSQ